MTKNHQCHCGEAETLEDEVRALGRQMRHFFAMLVDHANLDQSDQGQRTRARGLAQELERIIGGRPVAPGAFPECALIGNSSGAGYINDWFCTGTLIHPRVVISANHCIKAATGAPDPNSVALGVDKATAVTPSDIRRVQRITRHPTEDLALLVLQKPAEQAPITIATTEEMAAADRVELVGFGNDDPAGYVGFGVKRQVNVPMHVIRRNSGEDLSNQETVLGFDTFTEFVAGRKGSGKDSCKGDSGGPAYVFAQSGERKLAGATSRATDEADDFCGDGGVYVRLDAASEWITEQTAGL